MTDLNETIATFNKAWNAGEYGDLGLDSGLADETEYQQNYAPQRAAIPETFAADYNPRPAQAIERYNYSFMDPGFGDGFDAEEIANIEPNIFQEIIGGFETLGEKGRSFLADLFGTDPEKVGQFFKSLQGVMGYAGSKGGSSSARQLVRSAKTTAPTPRASGFRSTPVRRATPAQKAASNTASLIRQAQQNGTSTARIQNAKLANLLRNVVQVSETKPRTERLALPQQSISIRRRT
tara:strand:+ start:2092 stop:2799 length:708 start_codon:yes stop_codon:yes gene_type:complete